MSRLGGPKNKKDDKLEQDVITLRRNFDTLIFIISYYYHFFFQFQTE